MSVVTAGAAGASIPVIGGQASTAMSLTFPGGAVSQIAADQPVVSLAQAEYDFRDKLITYLDVGPTDPDKDLDELSYIQGGLQNVVPVYLDPAVRKNYLGAGSAIPNEKHAYMNDPPVRSIMIRCMVGYGVLHLNAFPDTTGAPPAVYNGTAWVVPLHADKGFFSLGGSGNKETAFFKDAISGELVSRPLGVSTIWLRTFSDANRFQIALFR